MRRWLFFILLFALLIAPHSLTYSQDDIPTDTPVEVPTEVPPAPLTDVPTEIIQPTLEPTLVPTDVPTNIPTEVIEPTVVPTELPTLEPTIATTEPPSVEPTTEATTPSETETAESTEAVTVEVTLTETPTPASTLSPEPSLAVLLTDNFDGGSLANWTGDGWTLVSSEGGQALQLVNMDASLFWTHEPVMDTAVEARLSFSAGTVIMNAQQSSVGGYSAQLSADGTVSLYRAGVLLGQAAVSPNAGQWRALRLSTAGDVVRVSVDGVEVIGVIDDAPLPPGIVSIAGMGVGDSGLLVDDVAIYTLDTGVREELITPTPETQSGVLLPPTPLTFTVDSTGDAPDLLPGDGNCLTTGTPVCTLRAAIQEANAHAGADFIDFDMAGSNLIQPASALPLITQAVTIDGSTNPGFDRVELSGALLASGNGLQINAGPTTIRGFVINGFDGANNAGIFVNSANNTIQNNYIGTDTAGAAAVPNTNGIQINSSGNLIGYIGFPANVISGNLSYGILINGSGASGNWLQGNFIGVDVGAVNDLGNGFGGIRIVGAPVNRIGGNISGMGNIISGNGGDGISIEGAGASGNLVESNLIGVDGGGTTAIPNNNSGVSISLAPNNVIGGDFATRGNLISGNGLNGVMISGGTTAVSGNRVQGNYIGTDFSGTLSIPNSQDGVLIVLARNTTIGGTAAGLGNVISGNDLYGIEILSSTTTLVQGNIIGLDQSGTAVLPNFMGVAISSGSNNTIGGTAAGARNIISGNIIFGVFINVSRGNIVQGNFLGTDISGLLDRGNQRSGVFIGGGAESTNNLIGGTAAGARNIISGNTDEGIEIFGPGTRSNLVQGNYIGTDVTGALALENGENGVFIVNSPNNTIGGTAAGARNIISGNGEDGIAIFGTGATGNLVQGNYIGTDVTGGLSLGNNNDGVFILDAPNNTIGGTAAGARNIISSNGVDGIDIENDTASGNRIQGNFIGTNVTGTDDLGNVDNGVNIVNAPGNTVGGTVASARNIISGNTGAGILIRGTDASSNLVQGNFIGTDVTGMLPLGDFANGGLQNFGILISDAPNNTVGGTVAGARNIIANAVDEGIRIQNAGSVGNRVQGNYIGMNVTGTTAIPNFGDGLFIHFASGNTIGGTVAGARNIISGNGGIGILIDGCPPPCGAFPADNNIIQGNYIGTDVTGTLDRGNGFDGIDLFGASNTLVGGTVAGARNLISGNNRNGVLIDGSLSSDNRVQGNYIGTNAAGTLALGNLIGGVRIVGGASNTTVGGSTAAARNVISGNNSDAVAIIGGGISTNSNVISGNYIGTNAAGTAALGNNGDGVVIEDGINNVIGGTIAGWGNRIAYNNGRGVVVFAANNNRISGNLIYNNFGIGIDLDNDDVTINDNLDPDTGANFLQNFPVLTSARPQSGIHITGTLNSLALDVYRLEFFASPACDPSNFGEGQVFLGRMDVITDGTGNVNFTVTLPGSVTTGYAITATATHLSSNNTSEFSRCIRYNLGIPTLSLLANGVLTADTTPTLTWSAVTGALDYRIQISTSSTFATTVVNTTVTPRTFTPGALTNGTYYWRVAARDAFGNDGPFSVIRSFTISHLPLPVLLTPANNATVGDLTPTLTWSAVTGAVSYRIQISNISDFSILLENQVVTVTNFTPTTPLLLGTYYWRVAAIDGAALQGAFGAARTLRINFAAPLLSAPANNITTSDATPTFTWLAVPNAPEYVIQISSNSTFTSGITQFSVTPAYTLGFIDALTPGLWYWRVAAIDLIGTPGSWSTVRRFTFRINTPVLSAPANNATVADTTPTFTWGIVPGAATYHIEVSTTSDFSIISASGLIPTNNFTLLTPLPASETYYWRVIAFDQYLNASASSVVRRVNIGP